MILLLRQGKISKWFSGIGQEAISVGAALALEADEYILPMHRNLGIFTTRQIPLSRLFAQFQGKDGGFTKGRDRSFHFGSNAHHIVGMISHLGPQLAVADGIALANQILDNQQVTLVFSGDGGTSEGDFHEALNVASVWGLPVIFVIENNGYGLSTPSSEQFNFESFTAKGPGYGMRTLQVDGNNLLEVFHTLSKVAKDIRKNPEPVLVEALTFRMRGHEEASGTKYVPKELMESWSKKDPVETFRAFLLDSKVLSPTEDQQIRDTITEEINQALETAYAEDLPSGETQRELQDVYAPAVGNPKDRLDSASKSENMRFVDAISYGLDQAMQKYPELILMGQDIAEYGGVFKVTEGFLERYGKDRVRNTPLCESAILGIALGLSIKGFKSVVEMQFADFVTCGFNQIVNNLAKAHYRWSQNADVVIRMPTGAGVGAGPYHSQSNEAWFFHTPGLKIVYPANADDAMRLLLSAIDDPNPVLFFEHKALYRSVNGAVTQDYAPLPIGKAAVVSEGNDISVITYGMGVHWALKLQEKSSHSLDIIDLRSLLPWDEEAVMKSLKKTGKVVILHEDCLTGGIGGEIAAWISENGFEYLDGPVMRVGSLDTPVPFSKHLEENFLPVSRFEDKVNELMAY